MENPWENVTSETSLDWQQVTTNISRLNCSVIDTNDTQFLNGCPNEAGKIFLWFDIYLILTLNYVNFFGQLRKEIGLLNPNMYIFWGEFT